MGPDSEEDEIVMISKSELKKFAQEASDQSIKKFSSSVFQAVGKGILSKLLWLFCLAIIYITTWPNAKNFLN